MTLMPHIQVALAGLISLCTLSSPARDTDQDSCAVRSVRESIERQMFDSQPEDVRVLVVNSEGVPVELGTSAGQCMEHALPRDWPRKPHVLVMPVASDATGDTPGRLLQAGKSHGAGIASFHLKGKEGYLALVLSPGVPVQVTPFQHVPGSEAPELRVELPSPGPAGTLTVDIRNPDGGAHHSGTALYILDGKTGIPLVARRPSQLNDERRKETWPPHFTLPVGDYILVARAEPHRDWHGRVRSERKLGDARVSFSIRADEATALEPRLTRGAFLDIALGGEPSAADVEEIRRRQEPGWITVISQDVPLAQRATIYLTREHGYPVPVEFRTNTMLGTTAAGMHMVSWLQLGSYSRSQALPAGRYTLEARLPGGRHLTQEVELVAGEVLDVKLDFGAGD